MQRDLWAAPFTQTVPTMRFPLPFVPGKKRVILCLRSALSFPLSPRPSGGGRALPRKSCPGGTSRRPELMRWMEACCESHYWARVLTDLGHEIRLISPQFVKPYVKSNKNDRND